MSKPLTTEQFIARATKIHGNRYDYSQVSYINMHTKVEIICDIHGLFEQVPSGHLYNGGCNECGNISTAKKLSSTTEIFIKKANIIHKNRYSYELVRYEKSYKKINIVCKKHGVFKQTPAEHLYGSNCPKCLGRFKEQYNKNSIPLYDTYSSRLNLCGVNTRRSPRDINVLEVVCHQCNGWFEPTKSITQGKILAGNTTNRGEGNLYCSYECKQKCSTFRKRIYQEGNASELKREVQPELRALRLDLDNHKCQVCFTDEELCCHHYEGVEINPIESSDLDNCITLCKKCHKDLHKIPGYTYQDYKRKPCKNI